MLNFRLEKISDKFEQSTSPTLRKMHKSIAKKQLILNVIRHPPSQPRCAESKPKHQSADGQLQLIAD